MTKTFCCISFSLSWPKGCNGIIDNAISIAWHWYSCQWCHMAKKVMLSLISIILTQGMLWCHWWCCWSQVMPVLAQCFYLTKKSCCTYFSHLDLRNAMLVLMMLATSCDANARVNVNIWPNKLYKWRTKFSKVLNKRIIFGYRQASSFDVDFSFCWLNLVVSWKYL